MTARDEMRLGLNGIRLSTKHAYSSRDPHNPGTHNKHFSNPAIRGRQAVLAPERGKNHSVLVRR